MQRKLVRKKKIPLLKILMGVLLLFFAGSTIFVIFFTNFFKVNTVLVKRDNIACADEEQLRQTSQILRQNILLINTITFDRIIEIENKLIWQKIIVGKAVNQDFVPSSGSIQAHNNARPLRRHAKVMVVTNAPWFCGLI